MTSNQHARDRTPSATPFSSCLALVLSIASAGVGTGAHALGAKKQSAADKPAVTPKSLIETQHVDHLDRLAREPMVVELTNGTLFVSGYDGDLEKTPSLWRSHDHGVTWQTVNVGTKGDGAIGNSDVDLAVGPDDTLYFVNMGFDRKVGEGLHIAVGVSRNAGATWSWTVLSRDRFDDRPWVGVTPDGTAHVIWNDGNGVRHAVSQDRGRSWKEWSRIHEQGGSSHLAIGPHGEIAVRVTPLSASGGKYTPGVDLVVVSRDGGKTWQKHPAPGQHIWNDNNGIPLWVEPVAWDATGALYYLWGTMKGLWLARSLDQGATWTNWHIVDRDEPSYYPYLIARGRGQLAATWSSGEGETLRTHVARIDVTTGKAAPQVIECPPFQTEIWSRSFELAHPGDPVQRVTAGEYIPVIFLRAGGLGVVTTIQNQPQSRVGFRWWNFK